MSIIHSPEEIGELIKEERKSQHLTQTELADLSGVSLSFITGLEKGKRTAEIGKAMRVLQTLGLDTLIRKRGQ